MTRVPLPEWSALDEASQALLEQGGEWMGFIPNDGRLMASVPGLLPAMSQVVGAAYRDGAVDMTTKRLVALMSSTAAGCRYCQSHARFGALRQGMDAERLEALWNYEDSSLFSDAEKAALNMARLASLAPNQVEDEDMARLREHFSDEQVLELVAVVALFGFLNRWNDTLKTEIEDAPRSTLEKT